MCRHESFSTPWCIRSTEMRKKLLFFTLMAPPRALRDSAWLLSPLWLPVIVVVCWRGWGRDPKQITVPLPIHPEPLSTVFSTCWRSCGRNRSLIPSVTMTTLSICSGFTRDRLRGQRSSTSRGWQRCWCWGCQKTSSQPLLALMLWLLLAVPMRLWNWSLGAILKYCCFYVVEKLFPVSGRDFSRQWFLYGAEEGELWGMLDAKE